MRTSKLKLVITIVLGTSALSSPVYSSNIYALPALEQMKNEVGGSWYSFLLFVEQRKKLLWGNFMTESEENR